MQKRKSSNAARKAWNIPRFAILWARKGGVFMHKRRFMMMHLPKFIKTLRHTEQSRALYYGDRQLSFDDTPVFHIKMHRPNSMRFLLPCINTPEVDNFDYDFTTANGDHIDDHIGTRKSFLTSGEHDEDDDDINVLSQVYEEEGIDGKAEEFIANFYAQLKLQRQISYLQYN